MNFFDHIDDYIAGKLQGDNLAEFTSALDNDESLRHAVDNYEIGQKLSEGLLEVDMLNTLNRLADEKESHQTDTNQIEKVVKPIWQTYLVAASITAILCLSGYFMLRSDPPMTRDQIMAEYYHPPIYDMERGTSPDEMTPLEKGKYAFHLKNYNVSEKILIQVLNASQDPDTKSEAQYYLGHIYMLSGEYKKATEYFNSSGFGDFLYQVEFVGCLVGVGRCGLVK